MLTLCLEKALENCQKGVYKLSLNNLLYTEPDDQGQPALRERPGRGVVPRDGLRLRPPRRPQAALGGRRDAHRRERDQPQRRAEAEGLHRKGGLQEGTRQCKLIIE